MVSLDVKLLDSVMSESVLKSRQVFIVLLESCWDIFYPYLSNEDIGKIDSALTDKSLKGIYIKQVSKFYLSNKIKSIDELEWIMKRGLYLIFCRLEFAYQGKIGIALLD